MSPGDFGTLAGEMARNLLADAVILQVIEGQSLMLATLNMFGLIAVCLGFAATIIGLVPKPRGQSTPAERTDPKISRN